MSWWHKISGLFGLSQGSCHSGGQLEVSQLKKIVIVGNPNVGKSALFNSLTGAYVTVSNYPGTTVDVSRGKARIEDEEFGVIDMPGMYSLFPITEEERIARRTLFGEKPEVVLQVVDARNLERMLPFSLWKRGCRLSWTSI